jgi:D-alanyl-D-alanine carboxypeptidase/D-alanyl-D-alanine-endopeptidase (penicillin-binding protein 4)
MPGMKNDFGKASVVLLLLSLVVFVSVKAATVPRYGGENLDDKLKSLLIKNHYPLSNVGVMLKNLDRDSILVSLNTDTPFNPASVAKLLTAAMAFDKLGAGYTYKTRVYMDGTFNADSGICNGNLYIKGSGDPSIVIERMWLFVQYLYRFGGIKGITGDVILDDSFFDTVSVGPCFEEDSSKSNPYTALVGALSANFNSVVVCEKPGSKVGNPVRVEVFPTLPLIEVVTRAKTGDDRKTSNYNITTERIDDRTRIMVNGSMAVDAQPYFIPRKLWQTWGNFGSIVKMFLEENKISFKGAIRRGMVPEALKSGKPFYVYESPPLGDIVNGMLKFSNNYYAEMLFKTISAIPDSGGGSWEKSSRIATAWWKEKGLPGMPVIKNGSGMGNCNRISALQLVGLLQFVWNQKVFLPEYLNSFPSAGVDGTLVSRFKESRLKGHLRGKTGTLNDFGVSTLSGYVLLPKGNYAFSILFNSMNSKYPYINWEMQQKILELIVP